MLNLKEQIFGDKGFSADMRLQEQELALFRKLISDQWLSTIAQAHPELEDEAATVGIQNYHLLTDRLDHRKIWPKSTRVLPQESVEQIKRLPFIGRLREEFGDFSISDIYDTHQHHGHEEIYWRLVRPNEEGDVGPLHADTWFHGAFNSGYGMFPDDVVTVKIWTAVHCEAGKNGLVLAAGSHRKEWKHHIETVNGLPTAYGTTHCGNGDRGGPCNEPNGRGGTVGLGGNGWHTWTLQIDRTNAGGDWRGEVIRWLVDGRVFHQMSGADIGDQGIWSTLAHSPMFMILNVAVGGNW